MTWAVHTIYFLATSNRSESLMAARDFACLATQAIQPVSLHAAQADEINYTAPLWPCSPQPDSALTRSSSIGARRQGRSLSGTRNPDRFRGSELNVSDAFRRVIRIESEQWACFRFQAGQGEWGRSLLQLGLQQLWRFGILRPSRPQFRNILCASASSIIRRSRFVRTAALPVLPLRP